MLEAEEEKVMSGGMVKLEFVYNEKKYWLKQLEMSESEVTVLIPSVIVSGVECSLLNCLKLVMYLFTLLLPYGRKFLWFASR